MHILGAMFAVPEVQLASPQNQTPVSPFGRSGLSSTLEINPAFIDVATSYNFKVLRQQLLSPQLGTLVHLICTQSGLEVMRVISPEDNLHLNPCVMISVRTPPDKNTGGTHLIEHCLLSESQKVKPELLFEFFSRDARIAEINAATYPNYTNYHFRTISPNFVDYAREYLITKVFSGKLEEDTFNREKGVLIKRIEGSDGKFSVAVSGRLYGEMMGRQLEPGYIKYYAMMGALYPGSEFELFAGGVPSAIRELSFNQLQTLHSRLYRPNNSLICEIGPHSLDQTLKSIRSHIIPSPGEFISQPIIPKVERLETCITTELPATNPGICIAWRVDLPDSLTKSILRMVYAALDDEPGSLLREKIRSLGLQDSIHIQNVGFEALGNHGFFQIELGKLNGSNSSINIVQAGLDIIFEVIQDLQKDGLPPHLIQGFLKNARYNLALSEFKSELGQDLLEELADRWQMGKNLEDATELGDRIEGLEIALANTPNIVADIAATYLKLPDDMQRAGFEGPGNYIVMNLVHNPSLALQASAQEAIWIAQRPEFETLIDSSIKTRDISWTLNPIQVPLALREVSSTLANNPVDISLRKIKGKLNLHVLEFAKLKIAHIRLMFDLRHLKPKEMSRLLLSSRLLMELGTKNRTAENFAMEMAQNSGGINFSFDDVDFKGNFRNPNACRPYLSLSAYAHAQDQRKSLELIEDLLNNPNWSDTNRLAAVARARQQAATESLMEGSSAFACGILRSWSGFSQSAQIVDAVEGLGSIFALNQFIRHLNADPHAMSQELSNLWFSTLTGDKAISSFVGSDSQLVEFTPALAKLVDSLARSQSGALKRAFAPKEIHEAIINDKAAASYIASYYINKLPANLLPILPVAAKLLSIRREASLHGAETYSGYCGDVIAPFGAPTLTLYFHEETDLKLAQQLVRNAPETLRKANISKSELDWAIQGTLESMQIPVDPYEQQAILLTRLLSGQTPATRIRFAQRVSQTTLADIRAIGLLMERSRDSLLSEVIFGAKHILKGFAKASNEKFVFRKINTN